MCLITTIVLNFHYYSREGLGNAYTGILQNHYLFILVTKDFLQKLTEIIGPGSIKSTKTRRDETQLMEYHNCYPTSIVMNFTSVCNHLHYIMTLNFNWHRVAVVVFHIGCVSSRLVSILFIAISHPYFLLIFTKVFYDYWLPWSYLMQH